MLKILLIICTFGGQLFAFQNKHFQAEISQSNFKNVTISQAIQSLHRKSQEIPGAGKDGFNYAFTPKAALSLNVKISLSLTQLPLFEALRYVSLQANLKVSFDRECVIFASQEETITDPYLRDRFTKIKPQMLKALKTKSSSYNLDQLKLSEVIRQVQKDARNLDPDKKGLNILLMSKGQDPNVTLSSKSSSFYSLLKYIALASNMQIKFDHSALLLTEKPQRAK